MAEVELKLRTARTIKWNVIDRVSSQVLYAVTGIVLANVLSQEDFGLVGAVMVFQAFASLFVDSGFSSALIQYKNPTKLDYSTVLWFNLFMAIAIYVILFLGSPLIAEWFQGDQRIIPLARVMFISFIINATAIVQTNRLMKKMDVRMIAISNSIGLIISAAVGIYFALAGYGAWAIVWQTITLGIIKSIILWATSRWVPLWQFSVASLRRFFNVGIGVATSSFLNTVFLNVYSFIIGNQIGLRSLGYYTQADKWSKMGITSLTQILTSSFLPVLSQVQDDHERLCRIIKKMNRFTAYLLFPAIGCLIIMATPVFHLLFGTKWDPSVILFQILLLRGIFTVLTSLYNNYILALGRARLLVYMEVVKDVSALLAIVCTLPYMLDVSDKYITEGIEILLWGQLVASIITYIVTLIVTAKVTAIKPWGYIRDLIPYTVITCVIIIPLIAFENYIYSTTLLLLLQGGTAIIFYFIINRLLKSNIQQEAIDYVMYRFRRKKGNTKTVS